VFINLEELGKMNWYLGLLAGRKERHMKITKLLSQALLVFGLVFSTLAVAQDDQVQDQDQNQPDPPAALPA
jgi:hypothetical protein